LGLDIDIVGSDKSSSDTPVQLVFLLDFLGADGMPDKLIKEGMKQPDQIKTTFEKGTNDVTGHVVPNQA
jgi:hypothetical protein